MAGTASDSGADAQVPSGRQQNPSQTGPGWHPRVTPPTSSSTPTAKLSLGSIVAIISLVGVITYGIAYIGGHTFYGHFGVDPADVGFTQQRALAHAGFLLIGLLLLAFFCLLTPLIIFACLWRMVMPTVTQAIEWMRSRRAVLGLWSVIAAAAAFVALSFAVGLSAQLAAEDVLAGGKPRPGWLYFATGVSVTPGQAVWTVPGPGQSDDRFDMPVALLGQNAGVTVVYVYATDKVLRIPSGAITFKQNAHPFD